MESTVIFHDGMDVDPDDMNNIQGFTARSLDNIVADALTSEARYAGFFTTRSGPTSIRVAPGRLFSGGKVYARNEEYTQDFVTSLPIAGKKIVAVVVWGSTVQTDSRAREFLINEETGASEPRPVAMEEARIANINVASGVEAPDPAAPLVDAGMTVVAHVLLTPTGVDTVTMIAESALPNLGKVDGRVASLEGFRSKAEPRISTIQSDIAKLANAVSGRTDQALTLRIAADVAWLKERAGLPDDRIDYSSDHYLDLNRTDTEDPRFLAKVEEGIRFSAENEGLAQLQVFDSLNPVCTVTSGWLLPASEDVARFDVGARTGEMSIAQYSYQTHELKQLTATRQRIRYGEEYTVCTNSAWWQSGQYDPISGIFTRNGETFQVGQDVNHNGGGERYHLMMRVRRFWYDTVEEPYWDEVTVAHTINGAQVGQTFLNSQDGWLSAIGLSFTRLAADGVVHIALTETERGQPNPERVIAVASLTRDQLALYPEKTLFPIVPTYLQAGKRYGLIVTTGADHWLATGQYDQGTLFLSIDGAYQQGDITRDICFSLHFKQFKAPRVVIDMQPLQLDGGIAAIDILAPTICPAACSVGYEVQVNSAWHPLQAVERSALIGLPPLVPLRIVLNGTTDMMPGIQLSGSEAKVSRPRKEYWHSSDIRTLPAGVQSSEVIIKQRLEYFDEEYHTASVSLSIGEDHNTDVAPTAINEEVIPDESAVERTYSFIFEEPVESYKIISTGTTSTALKTYHVAARTDISLS